MMAISRRGFVAKIGDLGLSGLLFGARRVSPVGRAADTPPFAVFSGDCLFAGSVGRPDLLGEDRSVELTKELFRSVREFYLKLPDDVRVHPAHGAGSPCGADISDRLVTAIDYERRFNPALQVEDEAQFVEYIPSTPAPEPRLG